MDETHYADRIPPEPEVVPAKRTRNTGAVATDLTPAESREYPDVPGYEIRGILGHGGMGVVYRARQLKANRLVALKMIRAFEHASPTDRLRFHIETEAGARLQHPHIVQLYEVGEVRCQPYFSLEFCDGGTLVEQLKKKPPTPREAAALMETLARAMPHAHLRGVVHRDLKPGNVLLAGVERVPKITDFGLAKSIDAEAREVSQSGAIMGTASYMAPEQAAGKVRDTGPAADVYALGALLYECLTGRPPFEGPQHVVLASVLNDEPVPPSRQVPKVPRDLETICLKCLSKEPARRYASAEELANDLRRFLADEPIRARPVGAMERGVKWAKGGRGYLYRLPTNSEWEYACRGGATSEEECSYHFYFDKPTNDLSSDQANFNGNFPFGKAAKGPNLQRPTRVGVYSANKLGLCDLHGNVWQWCIDEDARGSLYGRMCRGGSWDGDGAGCRAAHRNYYPPARRLHDFGFHLARVPVR